MAAERLISLDDLARVSGGQQEGISAENPAGRSGAVFRGNNFKTDSKQCRQGDVFVALPGERFDGHDYAVEVYGRGCSLVVSRKWYEQNKSLLGDGPAVLVVDDTLRALGQAAALWRDCLDCRLAVAITGSNGKTTCRVIIQTLFEHSALAPTGATMGNFNNYVGVPLSLFAVNEADSLVLEMGMNAPGEIDYLSSLVRPDVAVITSIGPGHIGFFKDEYGIARAKLEIINHVKKGGLLYLPADNDFYDFLESEAARLRPDLIRIPFTSSGWQMQGDQIRHQSSFSLQARLGGRWSLAYLDIGLDLLRRFSPADVQALNQASLDFQFMQGRFSVHETEQLVIVDDTYNANPSSLEAGLAECRRRWPDFELTAILGEMGELGEQAAGLHRRCGAFARRQNARLAVSGGQLAGEYLAGYRSASGTAGQPATHGQAAEALPEPAAFDNEDSLKTWLSDLLAAQKNTGTKMCLYFKGSRSAAMERFVSHVISAWTG